MNNKEFYEPRDTMVCWNHQGHVALFEHPDYYRKSSDYRLTSLGCYVGVKKCKSDEKIQEFISELAFRLIIAHGISAIEVHNVFSELIGYHKTYAHKILCEYVV